mgnify:FL=1
MNNARTTVSTLAAGVAGITLLAGSVAFAQDGPQVNISGFVDGSVSTTFYVGDGAGDPDPVVFGLDQAEIDFDIQVTDRLRIRTDINFFPMQGIAFDDSLIEQAYFEYYRNADQTGMFTIFGKMNAPIGSELLDPVDMYQFSYSPLFDYATPANLTGLFLGSTNGALTTMGWVSNDWDLPAQPGNISVGGRVNYDFDNGGNVGLALMGSSLTSDISQFMADVDFSYFVGDWTLFAQVNFATLLGDTLAGDDTISIGAMLKANYAFSDIASLTLRTTYLNRYQNLILSDAYGFSSYHGVEATVAGMIALSDNLSTTIELRVDRFLGDQDNGVTAITPALELTARF